LGDISGFLWEKTYSRQKLGWIPAFAGMTVQTGMTVQKEII
jgi:hypothetical protein